jgi:RNA polymerase sigma-70 factor (ECF subfamily)
MDAAFATAADLRFGTAPEPAVAATAGGDVNRRRRSGEPRRAALPQRESAPLAGDGAEEAALVASAQAGDNKAFEELARRHTPRLERVLVRITRDPEAAHDAVQDALIRAWQNIGRFEGRSSFFTWLTRIGINEAYRTMKRNETAATLPLDDAIGERIPGWGNRPDELFESREFLAAVDAALARLPVEYREAVVLRDVEALSTFEAADVLGIEEGALKSRLHRGRMALRRELDAFFVQG